MSEPPGLFMIEGFWPFTSASPDELRQKKPPLTADGFLSHCYDVAVSVLRRDGIDEPRDPASFQSAVQSVQKESMAANALWLLHDIGLASRDLAALDFIAQQSSQTDRENLPRLIRGAAMNFACLMNRLNIIASDLGPKGEGGVLKPAQANMRSKAGASVAGAKSAATRRRIQRDWECRWKPHVLDLAKLVRAEDQSVPQDKLAAIIEQRWNAAKGGGIPTTKSIIKHISEMEKSGDLPRRTRR